MSAWGKAAGNTRAARRRAAATTAGRHQRAEKQARRTFRTAETRWQEAQRLPRGDPRRRSAAAKFKRAAAKLSSAQRVAKAAEERLNCY